MSFEENPADNENYERDLAYAEIKELQAKVAELEADLAASKRDFLDQLSEHNRDMAAMHDRAKELEAENAAQRGEVERLKAEVTDARVMRDGAQAETEVLFGDLKAMCEESLPDGHPSVYVESPLEYVTAIIDDRDRLQSANAALTAMLAAAAVFEFPNNLRLVQCNDGSWHVWMPGQPGAFKKTLAEAYQAAQAAGWLADGTTQD